MLFAVEPHKPGASSYNPASDSNKSSSKEGGVVGNFSTYVRDYFEMQYAPREHCERQWVRKYGASAGAAPQHHMDRCMKSCLDNRVYINS